MTSWDSNECLIKMVTQCYRARLEDARDRDLDRIKKSFQSKMKKRYRVHTSMVKKYKYEIYFMIEIDTTCIKAIKPRVNFIEPTRYEMSDLIEGCVKIIL